MKIKKRFFSGLVFAGLVIVGLCSFGYGYGDFMYWAKKGRYSTDPDEQIKCYTKAIKKWTYSDGYENKAIAGTVKHFV